MELVAIAGGVALGALAALPMVLQLRAPSKPQLGRGIIAVMVAFATIQVAMLVLYATARQFVAPVGVAAALTFLVLTTIAVLRAHHGEE